MPPRAKTKNELNPSRKAILDGIALLKKHPLFSPLMQKVYLRYTNDTVNNACPSDAWAIIDSNGTIHCHPTRRGSAENWTYVIAHCLLHLGFGHHQAHARDKEWNLACCAFVARFLRDMKLGTPPDYINTQFEIPAQNEESLYSQYCSQGISFELSRLGVAGEHNLDMPSIDRNNKKSYERLLAEGLNAAVTSAVNVAGGYEPYLGATEKLNTISQKARSWFINSYPLLGAMAAAFTIVEDPAICQRMEISVAAVDAEASEIYINPAIKLTEQEARFVMAHELLHVGLRHQDRRQGRDPYLWNVACDYVINGWLVEMGIGEKPYFGTLYDPQLKGLSADQIYLTICCDLRKYRKLATLKGTGCGDILERGRPDWWNTPEGIKLDDFYRRTLSQGLDYHQQQGRGFVPAGLEEEIKALSQPAIAWDVELAQWFDDFFTPIEKNRSYARPSRRQSSTPDIARAKYVYPNEAIEGRTYAVLLDTSGSMDRKLLAKALGSIASYSLARDVPYVRLIFCDASAYDQGYVAVESIAQRIKVKGRGGTVLQPGLDLIEAAKDFPEKGPVLIITDGYCDHIHTKREHAYLMPQGMHLPYYPKGPIFRIS